MMMSLRKVCGYPLETGTYTPSVPTSLLEFEQNRKLFDLTMLNGDHGHQFSKQEEATVPTES